MNKKKTTTTGLHVPGLEQAHKVCGGVKHICERSTLPVNIGKFWENTKLMNYKNLLNLDLTLEIEIEYKLIIN